jgi:uncharacterized protein YndB with AHSA1/START domain
MEKITKKLKLGISPDIAFQKFVNELNEWWPKEYTWSQDKLKEIKIDGRKDGLCMEIGPNGFRCDWGTVIEFTDNEKIRLKWQISPKREPVPNPENASDLSVDFTQEGSSTTIKFEHFNFENHGEGSDDYRKMMDSEQGWDYILNSFKKYCEKQ